MKSLPTWTVPVDDGSQPASIEIRERVVPPCVLLKLSEPSRLLTPTEAAHLAQALNDAAREAARRKR